MKQKYKILFLILFAVILLPVLFYPISTDLGEFLLGGKTIADGGKIYVNFIDIKPPLCYYLFALFYLITGNSEFLIRVIDVLWQMLTVVSIIYTMNKLTSNSLTGYLSSLVYCFSYTVLQYYNTFQLETMIAIPLIWVIYFSASQHNIRSYVYSGLLIGLIIGLKYSFGVIIFPVIILEFLNKNKTVRTRLLNVLTLSLFSILAFVISSLPLLMSDIRNEYFTIQNYMTNYNVRAFDNYFFYALKSTYLQLTGRFSYLFLIAAILSSSVFFSKNKSLDNRLKNLLILSCSMFFILWISIVVERKFFEYHYARLFLPLSLMSGVGLVNLTNAVKQLYLQNKLYLKLLAILSVLAFVIISPVPRWAELLRVPYYFFTDTSKYDIYYEIPDNPVRFRVYQKEAAQYLKSHFKPTEKVFVMGIGSNIIYLLAGADNFSRYSMSSFYFYSQAPLAWRNDIQREMSSSKWLVVAFKSSYPYFTRDNKTVLENIQANPALDALLKMNFKLEFQNERYQIYHRNF